jgi:hypothetical protein
VRSIIAARAVAVGVVAATTGRGGGVGDARDSEESEQYAEQLEVFSHDGIGR